MSASTIVPGLVSITYRALNPSQILALMEPTGLRGIEWGGDVHVRPGDEAGAREVGQRTRDLGRLVSSYGSYYRVGQNPGEFSAILRSAVALQAPRIRVWAGIKDAGLHTAEERAAVLADLRRIAALAGGEGIRLALEFHGGTLTSDAASTAALLTEVHEAGVDSYWQTRVDATPEQALADMAALAPWICNIHVFHWHPGCTRRALAEGAPAWQRYVAALRAFGRPLHAQLEYVPEDRPEALAVEAATLCRWLAA